MLDPILDFLKNLLWVAMFGGFLFGIYKAGRAGWFDKANFSKDGTAYRFDASNWRKYYPGSAAVLLLIFAAVVLSGCSSGESEPAPVVVVQLCHGTYGGRVVKPSDAEQKAAFAESRRRGETNFGGGTNGGFYLEGAYGFKTDASCNIVSGEFVLHGHRLKVTGGTVRPDGTFSGSHGGGPFEGAVVAGVVSGYVSEGGNRTYMLPPNQATRFIFGRMDGVFAPEVKL
jgi:hypothetical protein